MPKEPIELMFSAYRRGLLATLLLRPGERFHVRELGRMTGIPAGSLHRELKALAEAGVLQRERVGNQVFYIADQACPIYTELAAIFRKTSGLASILREALSSLSDKIEVALVFGSMASGKQVPASDVDVLVIGDVSLAAIVKVLSPLQATLGRDINPVAMSPEKFLRQLDRQERLALRIVKEPKLFVIGNADEFAEFIEDRVAR